MNTVVFDIETDGLLDDLTRIVCLSYKENSEPVKTAHEPKDIEHALRVLQRADCIAGHNLICFDLPAIRKLHPWFRPEGVVRDTLVMSRLVFANLRERDMEDAAKHKAMASLPAQYVGSHSLKAWGYRLGLLKIELVDAVEDFKNIQYSESLREYCERDVAITHRLYGMLMHNAPVDAVILEHDFAQCIFDQMQNGFGFDLQAAAALYSNLSAERDALIDELQTIVPPTEIQLKTKVKYIPFNPGSRQQIAKVLMDGGWKPEDYTPTGDPKIDETVLSKIDDPIAVKFSRYLLLVKRIGMLSEGTESWMKSEKGGRIYGYVNHNGAVTGRCTHRNPNMAQVPSSSSPYGKECRALFVAGPGMLLVGVDASGLELRCLAHYMAKYDGGSYAKELLEGDIHTANQQAAGLPTRNQAKVFIYGFLYGAGPAKIGAIVGGSYNEGKILQDKFLKKVPALRELRDDVQHAAKARGYLFGLDGRRLPIRSIHAALNTLLQSAGAIIMKKAALLMNDALQSNGIDYRQVAHIHDELQFEVKEDQADQAKRLLPSTITDAGKFFNFRCPLDGEARIGKNWSETH